MPITEAPSFAKRMSSFTKRPHVEVEDPSLESSSLRIEFGVEKHCDLRHGERWLRWSSQQSTHVLSIFLTLHEIPVQKMAALPSEVES
jgi:hypothetical protein